MAMEQNKLMLAFVFGLLFQNLFFPVMAVTETFEEQKNYYNHDPHSPPSGHHGGGGHHTPTPSHGGGSYSPPSHSTPSSPPKNCGTPPSTPHYSPPYTPTPVTPTPSTPTPTPVTPTPYVPTPTPPTPTTPSPPYVPDPNSPFTCNYWRTHPTLIWGVLGWWGTLGNAFGVTSLPGYGATMSIPQALSNTRTDGYGSLYREGSASLLNSMATHKFPYTTKQVRDSFIAALGSNKAAATQGNLFRMANEGKIKPRN